MKSDSECKVVVVEGSSFSDDTWIQCIHFSRQFSCGVVSSM
jgi:hypothetical protein